jgi:hypothetical protein
MRNPPSLRPVLVFGAAGHTAAFVVQSLLRHGHNVLLAGRNMAKLRAAFPRVPDSQFRLLDIEDTDLMLRTVAEASIVVNCAGPFADTTEQLLHAAIETGAHYIDIAAEQNPARAVFERWDDRVSAAGVVAVPAMGFYGGLGDLLATAAMGDWPDADAIELYTALDSWHPTAGTRRTGQRNSGRRLIYTDGQLQPAPLTPPRSRWRFAAAFGEQDMVGIFLADVITIPNHLQARNVSAWINEAPMADLHSSETPAPVPVDDSGRSAQRFTVQAVARRGGIERRAAASGQDIYAVTGPMVGQAVTRILAADGRHRGSFSAGQLFDAREFLASLAPEHLALEVGP